jgi:predicted nucleotidyltransferase component of viral defense system
VQRAFSYAASIAPLINNTDELTVLIDDVKVTFLKYPFPTFDPFVIYEGVPLLSVREIAATKSYTIGRRGAYKDYIDLYFILSEQHARSPTSFDAAERKFGFEFNSRLFLEQLVFLNDVEDTDIQFLKTVVTQSELLNFFEANIRVNAERL